VGIATATVDELDSHRIACIFQLHGGGGVHVGKEKRPARAGSRDVAEGSPAVVAYLRGTSLPSRGRLLLDLHAAAIRRGLQLALAVCSPAPRNFFFRGERPMEPGSIYACVLPSIYSVGVTIEVDNKNELMFASSYMRIQRAEP